MLLVDIRASWCSRVDKYPEGIFISDSLQVFNVYREGNSSP